MPVTVYELPGSPRGSFQNGRMTATRELKVAWSDIEAYMAELMPATTVVGSTVSQYPGAAFPYIAGLYVESFTWEPFWGKDDRITNECSIPVQYDSVRFTVNYAVPNYPVTQEQAAEQQDPVPFLEHAITSGGQLLDIAAPNDWRFQVSTALVGDDVPVAVMVGTTQHSVHWPRVVQPNWPNLDNFCGHVNEETFYLGGKEYPAETLLYINYDRRDVVMTNGTTSHDLTLHFEGKRVKNSAASVSEGYDEYGGHNHFWDKDAAAWAKVYRSGATSTHPFPKAAFNDLFKAGA